MENKDENRNELRSRVKELTRRRSDLWREQFNILENRLDVLSPEFKFMIENSLYFNSNDSRVKLSFTGGPILYYHERENEVYVYDVKSNRIKVLNNYNRQEISILSLFEFTSKFGIEEAMESLVGMEDLPERTVSKLEKNIDHIEATVNKFKN